MPWTTRTLPGRRALSTLRALVRRDHRDQRRDQRHDRPRDRRRRTRLLLWAFAGVALTAFGWLVISALWARGELMAAKDDLKALRGSLTASASPARATAAGGPASRRGALAEGAARSAAEHAERAHWLTEGPLWAAAAWLPGPGGVFETVRGAAGVLDRLAGKALPPVVRTVGRLDSAGHGSHLDVSELGRSAPDLERAARQMGLARTEADRLPRHTWLAAVDRVRGQLVAGLDRMAPAMENAAVGARLLPPMLGGDGARRYLVVFQNSAESRGTGGMPGAYAVLTADKGALRLKEFGRDTDMAAVHPKVSLGAEYASMYALDDPVNTWPNSNMSPHFPYAARIWSAAWLAKSGERVDGVLSLDPGVLSTLLAAAGPARMSDGTLVTAADVVDLTERTAYAKYRNSVQRKAFLLDVARAAAGRLLTAAQDSRRRPALLLGLYKVLRDGRMAAWSAHAQEQRELAARPVGGSVPQGPAPYAGLVVNNAAGTKLDYYLDRGLEWSAGRCTPDGREVTVKVVLTNRAPSKGLPAYVTDRLDEPAYRTRAGDNRLLVSYYATKGAALAGATLDGKRVVGARNTERGHPVYTLDVEVPAGHSRALTLNLLEPPSAQTPTVPRQQLSRPMRVTVHPAGTCPGLRR
ncbi:DUF4012 domain-containing protein [Streptomyces sp. NPDC047022]|uniref:DUF4012 domain-containing protein n=1 Tax=Streptomyces sp. NPDC047022 TaxID=3155737 RepID=UPI0033D08D66